MAYFERKTLRQLNEFPWKLVIERSEGEALVELAQLDEPPKSLLASKIWHLQRIALLVHYRRGLPDPSLNYRLQTKMFHSRRSTRQPLSGTVKTT
eukprot:2521896-Amphidinium_carterae.4